MLQSGLGPFILYVFSQSEIDNIHKDIFFFMSIITTVKKMSWSGQSIL